MEPVTPRIAIVGLGYWGPNLVRNFHALGCLGGIFDTSTTSLRTIGERYPEAIQFDCFDSILADSSITGVVIATPAVTHGEMVYRALLAGKHVFVEKPLCLDVETGVKLRSLSRKLGLTLMVGHLLHYHPAFQAALDFIQNGGIGDLRYMYSNRLSVGKVRTEENALWSFAPHDIAMMLAVVGRMPETVACHGMAWLSPDVADTTISHFSFGESIQAHIFVSWLHPYKEQRLVIVGSESMIVFTDTAPGPEKLQVYRHAVRIEQNVPVIDKARGEPLPYEDSEPLRNECIHFIECIQNGSEPKSGADEGLRVLRVLNACQEALTTGVPFKLGQ